MKDPMKGATIVTLNGRRRRRMRYIGITEPGIIAAGRRTRSSTTCDHAGHRSARGVRAHGGPRASWCSPAASVTPEKSSTCSASCCARRTGPAVPADVLRAGGVAPYFEQIDRFIRLTRRRGGGRYEHRRRRHVEVARRMTCGRGQVRRNASEGFVLLQLVAGHPARIPAAVRPYPRGDGGAGPACGARAARPAAWTCGGVAPASSPVTVKEPAIAGLRRTNGPFEDPFGDADMMRCLDALLRAFVAQGADEDRRRPPAPTGWWRSGDARERDRRKRVIRDHVAGRCSRRHARGPVRFPLVRFRWLPQGHPDGAVGAICRGRQRWG